MDQQGPSQGVHDQLLPHVHLVSTQKYPSLPRVEPQRVTEWLLAAPKIARDSAPFYWRYLETPPDGSIYLTWQPLARHGADFASDGYIYSGPEILYAQELGNGLVLEIYYQKGAFKPMPMEPYTMHSRRRFRLVPSKVPHPSAPPVDPSLWIVSYGPSEPHDRIPSTSVPIDQRTSHVINFRMQLLRAGQIKQKPFMLADRGSWPQIPMPSMYPQQHGTRPAVPQTMAYPPNAGHLPPPKRASRGGQQPPHHLQQHPGPHPMAGHPVLPEFDEEDTSRGDMFDHLSPRDVSLVRYTQNHDWIEEVLATPYRMSQITMPDLGLGLKGELASLTEGIFEAQGENARELQPKKPYVGRLDGDLADEFRKRVAERIEATQAEIKKLEEDHAKSMAEFESGRLFMRAERDLRGISKSSETASGGDFWRLEGRLENPEEEAAASAARSVRKDPDVVVTEVEAAVGRKAVPVQDVRRVQDGGYQEPVVEPPKIGPDPVLVELQQQQQPLLDPMLSDVTAAGSAAPGASMSRNPSNGGSQHSGVMVGDSDMDMGGTAAGLLDQMQPSGFSSTSTPLNNFPTPQTHLSAGHSNAGTPANANVPSPHPPSPQPQQPVVSGSADIDMGNTETSVAKETTPTTAPDQGTGSGDWVVVPKADDEGTSVIPPPAMQPTVALAGNSAGATPAASATGSKPLTPGEFGALGDLEGEDMDLNMDMDDSAFGDAFHGVSESSRDGAGAPGSGSNL